MILEAAPTQAVVLVGGLGTRLGSLTGGLPKPMVDVGGKPFLSYLLWHAGRFGFSRILLLAGHRAEAISGYARALAPTGVEIEVIVEPSPLGTAGALRFAADGLDERVLLLNGDSLFDFNWLDLLTDDDARMDVALSLRREADASRFGVVETDGAQITGFRERGDRTGGLINGGVYVIRRGVAQACPRSGSFEREVLPGLAAAGRVRGREAEGFFLDIGVPEALARAQAVVPASLRRPALVFDRSALVDEGEDPSSGAGVMRWKAGAIDAVKAVNDAGRFAFLAVEDDVAQDRRNDHECRRRYEHMQFDLRGRGAHFDAAVPSNIHADAHLRPAVGRLRDLVAAWPIDRARSLMIGAGRGHVEAAAAAGIEGVDCRSGELSHQVSLWLTGAPGDADRQGDMA